LITLIKTKLLKLLHQTFLFLILIFLGLGRANCQFVVDKNPPNNSPNNLINNVLLGKGVTVTSISFQGDSTVQFGIFADPNLNVIGLDSGIVLSTGDINEIDPNFTGAINSPFPNVQDIDLLNIANSVPGLIGLTNPFTVGQVNNLAAISFEFVPESDTVEFRFVFGSQEYPLYDSLGNPTNDGFINQQFNDVFGFFISGPGITGSFSSPPKYPGGSQNVAFIPNTNPQVPITVSSVHNGGSSINPLNSQYFIPGNLDDVNLRGFTVPLTAKLALSACDTFHIRLAIADGQDQTLNSCVFLEAKSFGSPNVRVDAKPEFYSLNSDGNLYEDCGDVSLTFSRFNNISSKRRVNFKIGGTAQNGIDYSFIPDSIIFQPGNPTSTLNINIFSDGILEGNESMIIGIQPDTIGCVVQDSTFTTLIISDPLKLELGKDSLIFDCFTDSLFITKSVVQGIEPFNYYWSTGDSLDTLIYKTQADSIFYVTVTDACKNDSVFGSVKVNNLSPTLIIDSKNDSIICTDTAIQIGVNVLSGSSQQVYLWDNGKQKQNIFISTNVDTFYTVTVTDLCSPAISLTDTIEVFSIKPPLAFTVNNDTIDCLENGEQINVKVLSGSAKQSFNWSTGDTTQFANVTSNGSNTKYFVTVTDFCDQANPKVDSSTVFEFNPPLTISTKDDTLTCNANPIQIGPNINTGSIIQSFLWNTGDTTATIAVNPISTTVYTVTVTDFCNPNPTKIDSIKINVVIPPLVIEPSSATTVCDTAKQTVSVKVISGSSPLKFLWSNGEVSPSFKASIISDTSFIIAVTDGCGNIKIDTANFDFTQSIPIISLINDTTLNCPNDTAFLNPLISGGNPPYSLIWITGESKPSIKVTPDTTTKYIYQITDLCPGVLILDTVEVIVQIPQPLTINMADTGVDCNGDSAWVTANITGGIYPYTYQWSAPKNQTGDSIWFNVKDVQGRTSVFLNAQDYCLREASEELFITINSSLSLDVSLSRDTLICRDDEFIEIVKVSGGVPPYKYAWLWDGIPLDIFSDTVKFLPDVDGILSVIVVDKCKVEQDDDQTIFLESCNIETQNIFTPNGDGKNDFLIIQGIAVSNFDETSLPTAAITIFNRWGLKLYEADPYQNNWDAYGLPDGIYYYIVELSNGKTLNKSVTIIR